MMYGSWDMKCDRQNFLSFWAMFCPFTPLSTQKIQNFEKMKTPGDIIILHMCTKNHDHMLFFIWSYSLPFYPPNSPNNQNLKNEKKTWRYHHFKHVHQKLGSGDVWFLRYGARRTDGQTDGKGDI